LVFQLHTHHDLFDGDGDGGEDVGGGEKAQLSVAASLIALTVITVTVSLASE
jgi:hypothetical protein